MQSALLLATRLDWGFGNPNKTAALIALLIIAVWALPLIHRQLFWLALVLCMGLGVLLLQTASRGGVAALIAGMCCLVFYTPKPWPRVRVAGVILGVWVVIGAMIWLGTAQRLRQGILQEDKSITHRLALWRVTPRMMVDAPNGWGLGNAGAAFIQWYEPPNRAETYRTLVNSHLTWLVELGWVERFFYVSVWLSVLLLCWPGSARSDPRGYFWMAVPLGIWVCFAINAWFSSVAEAAALWIIPSGGLIAVSIWRWRARRWPEKWMWIVLGGISGTVLLCCFACGLIFDGSPRIRCTGYRIIVGEKARPDIWMVINQEVLGKTYGRTLRRYLAAMSSDADPRRNVSLGFVSSANELRPSDVEGKTLVITGQLDTGQLTWLKRLLPNCGKVVLINPIFYPQDLEANLQSGNSLEVIAGEFSRVPTSSWREATRRPVESVEGAGEFLPRWPELVLTGHLDAQ